MKKQLNLTEIWLTLSVKDSGTSEIAGTEIAGRVAGNSHCCTTYNGRAWSCELVSGSLVVWGVSESPYEAFSKAMVGMFQLTHEVVK